MRNKKTTILIAFLPITIAFSAFSITQKTSRKPKVVTSAKRITPLKSDTSKRYTCQTCGKSYTQSTTLKRHIESIHVGKVYHCQHCEKTFTTYQGLWQHKKTILENIRHECKICGTEHRQLAHLRAHEKSKIHLTKYTAQCMAKKESVLTLRRNNDDDTPTVPSFIEEQYPESIADSTI